VDARTLIGSLLGAAFIAELRVRREVRKLKADGDEAHFRPRQSDYHRLLNVERRIRDFLPGKRINAEEYARLRDELQDAFHAVVASATAIAASAESRLKECYEQDPTD
jgi:hypothetical protein